MPEHDTRREPSSTLAWTTALDNHLPTREFASGTALVYAADEKRNETIALIGIEAIRDPHSCLFLLDDGHSVTAWYVAGWYGNTDNVAVPHPRGDVFLQEFPTNPEGRTRTDNGRLIDYSNWMLGPRRAYHLKIRPA